jgi:hypothetical protein
MVNFRKLSPIFYWLILLLVFMILSSCTPLALNLDQSKASRTAINKASITSVPNKSTIAPTQAGASIPFSTEDKTPYPESITTTTPTSSPTVPAPTATHLTPGDWMLLPIIPTVSQTARQIYTRGLGLGTDAHVFSKIGDCQSITTYFLANFDTPGSYDLGPYTSLQDTIDWYSGSFARESLAVKGGFNAAAILSPLRADPKQCHSSENPVACELHLHHPSVAIISLEEWWSGHPENYEKYMRQIIEYTISQGVVPILATKADNLEGNNLINETIANLAQEYDIPLWNFWASVQDLPNHGLAAYDPYGNVDMFHLTHGELYDFSDELAYDRSGWTMRNLTALQALDAVRRGLVEQP